MENNEVENNWKKALEGAEVAPSDSVWSGIEAALSSDELPTSAAGSSWKAALEGVEESPSPGLWNSVEADLIAAENITMRRAVIRYQRIAAAAIFFALLVGAYSIFYTPKESTLVSHVALPDSIAKERLQKVESEKSVANGQAAAQKMGANTNSSSEISIAENKKGSNAAADKDAHIGKSQKKYFPLSSRSADGSSDVPDSNLNETDFTLRADPLHPGTPLLSVDNSLINEALDFSRATVDKKNQLDVRSDAGANLVAKPTADAADKQNNILGINAQQEIASSASLSSADSMRKAIAAAESPLRVKPQEALALPWEEKQPETVIRKDDRKENTWASVGAAAGVFNPGTKGTATQNATSGPAYSFGASVAGRVLPKWVIQGGVSYMNQSTGEGQVTSPALSANLASSGITDYNQALRASEAGTYAPTSTVEFISVPLQAGYMLVDHKVGFLLNAGIASNFFVKNSIQDETGHVSTFSTSNIDQTPYKRVTMSGLMSTELSYRLARQYRIALVPGIRYALNSTMKQVSDRPYIMDLGLRVRYNF